MIHPVRDFLRKLFHRATPPIGTPVINMDDGATIIFEAGGRQIVADPFDLLTELVKLDERHGYRPGAPLPPALLDDVGLFAAKFLKLQSVSRAQAMRFYAAVTTSVDELTEDLKKKLGRTAGSPTGTA